MASMTQNRGRTSNGHRTTAQRASAVFAVVLFVVAIATLFVLIRSTDAGATASQPLAADLVAITDHDVRNAVELVELTNDVLAGSITDGNDGNGIDVALIDTGVALVDGLDSPGKVLHGPDLSLEGLDDTLNRRDSYGHGTHIAGIIAGERDGHRGIAPGARIVSVKVAGADGQVDLAKLIAAIDWVVAHRSQDGLNIRVLNLSYGLPHVETYLGDPLSAAIERAWNAGIFVVVAGGNERDTIGHLSSPAIDPLVMAVGSSDSTSGVADVAQPVAEWSSRGDGVRNPDLVAPGRSIASYRVPGSTIDNTAPTARYGDDLFLGSGTSQSAAVVSGVAARLLERYPAMTPSQLKATLKRTARNAFDTDASAFGAGVIDAEGAINRPMFTIRDEAHAPAALAETEAVPTPDGMWTGGTWAGGTWAGGTWAGGTWAGGTWSGGTWSGGTWAGGTWSGGTWSGGTWSGGTWSGGTWS